MSDKNMQPGEVIRTVRDAIKKADLPGDKRVARKGSHILFTVGNETYSCAIKRVNPNRKTPVTTVTDSMDDGINTGS